MSDDRVMLMGQMAELRLKVDNVSSWTERFELYVELNDIGRRKQKLMFLTLLGNEGYSLIRGLCLPHKPVDKSYSDLKALLLSEVFPKPFVFLERYIFKKRKQRPDETVDDFVSALKKMSEQCEFDTSLDGELRNQLIWGLRDHNVKLILNDRFSFERTVELCRAMEQRTNVCIFLLI